MNGSLPFISADACGPKHLELSRGRDITIKPAPKAGPFNYFFGPHLEVNGKEVPVKATFEFKRLPARSKQ